MDGALDYYCNDSTLAGDPAAGASTGGAGGAACGDWVEVSLRIEGGRIGEVSWRAEGCATARAAIAATAALIDGATLAEAALLDADAIEAELGGLTPIGRHAPEIASEALHRALGSAVMDPTQMLAEAGSGAGPGPLVLVAMSGGVDSAVAALLEREGGAEVIGVTLELWSDPANDGEASCCSAQAVRTARSICHGLGIPHLTVDLRRQFERGVVAPFLEGYAAGDTPNPCIVCNGKVRLAPMIALADRLGAEGLATGHYARLTHDEAGPLLVAATDQAKDQTYMLAALPRPQLARMRFPLGELEKPEVREHARRAGLGVADKAESQDLCFLAGVGKRGFLAAHGEIEEREGEIVDAAGTVLGNHRGHHNFTIGQRKGIGLAAREPLYVIDKDPAANRVVVGFADQLDGDVVELSSPVLHRPAEEVESVRLRYRSRALPCRLELSGPGARITLQRRVRRPAPGQEAVFYRGETIVGHARIAGSG